jgi:hypothetical protein
MMDAASTSETLVNFYQTTWRYNPEDSHLSCWNVLMQVPIKTLMSELKLIMWLHCSGADSGSTKPVLTTVTPRPYSTTLRPAPTSPRPLQPCRGECVGGLFALFCDDIDSEANCPDDGSCCVTSLPSAPPSRDPDSTKPATSTISTSTTTTRWLLETQSTNLRAGCTARVDPWQQILWHRG